MTTSIKTVAGALVSSSLVSFIVGTFLAGPLYAATPAEEAVSWAIAHRAEAFDRLMPAARSTDVSVDGSLVTVRAAGFEDHYEFLLEVKQDGLGLGPTARLVLPVGAPLVIQLARAKLGGAEDLASALRLIQLKTLQLPTGASKRIHDELASFCMPLAPQRGPFLHRDTYEITAVGWSELRLVVTDDGDRRRPIYRALFRNIRAALDSVGVGAGALSFDPRQYYDSVHTP
jgi:hypothetical protein